MLTLQQIVAIIHKMNNSAIVRSAALVFLVVSFPGLRLALADEKPGAVVAATPFVAGRWSFAERQVTIQVNCTSTNQCEGTIVESPRPAEVGLVALQQTHFDAGKKKWVGKLVMPETGSNDVEISTSGSDRIQLVAKRFIFTKTLVWVRS